METTIKTFSRLLGLFLLFHLIQAVAEVKTHSIAYDQRNVGSLIQAKSYVNVNNVDRTLHCLALNIYKEAAHESFEGKVGVAQVVLNRVEHPGFPKDVCSVVYQKNVVMQKVVCQFSWYCQQNANKKPTDPAFQECYAIAKKVLLEGFRLDILNDALFFHAVHINPRWRHERIARIGNHIFYRSRT